MARDSEAKSDDLAVAPEIEITDKMVEAGVSAMLDSFLALHDADLAEYREIARTVFCRMQEARSHPHPNCLSVHNKRDSASLKSALQRMDLIHLEFERRKRLGLQSPSLHDVDQLFGRPFTPVFLWGQHDQDSSQPDRPSR